MSKTSTAELAFLKEYDVTRDDFFSASWLKSPFPAKNWDCKFGDVIVRPNFGARLDDDLPLNHPRHETTFSAVKGFLCLQTHPYVAGRLSQAVKTQQAAFARGVFVIDYFLLRAQRFQLAKHGFSMVSRNDVAEVVSLLRQQAGIKAVLYDVYPRVEASIAHICETQPETRVRLAGIDAVDAVERVLPLNDADLVHARKCLFAAGYYRRGNRKAGDPYTNMFNVSALLKDCIGQQTIGNLKFDNLGFDELSFGRFEGLYSEFPPVPVVHATEDDRASEEYVQSFLRTIDSMRVAEAHGFQLVSSGSLDALYERPAGRDDTKGHGRFTTLPGPVAAGFFRKSVDLLLDFGDTLVDAYLGIVRDIAQGSPRSLQASQIVSNEARRLGVQRWSIPTHGVSSKEYFERLRRNEGLLDMLHVLLGGLLVLINTLMARRAHELLTLNDNCVITTSEGLFLRFILGKANVGEIREIVRRPMPNVAGRAIRLILRLKRGTEALGLAVPKVLFVMPLADGSGLRAMTAADFALCLNRFSDWMASPLDERGRRHYPRIHQLRRNFAMWFFYRGGTGGLEVLRYFLGHTNWRDVWRYIQESVSGRVLTWIRAGYAASHVQAGQDDAQSLARLIVERYGIADLKILPEADLTDHIADLLKRGEVTVEPIFFDGANGEDYKIMINVTPKRHE